jgi:agmatine deiminase
MTGHADGYVRIIDNNTILVNEIKENEYKYWMDGFIKMVKQHQLNCIEVPWFEYKVKDKPDSAIGLYLNYLEIEDLIILPVFEVKGNMDQKIIDLFESLFPYKYIEPVNINPVGQEGGLMNCISWNIRI